MVRENQPQMIRTTSLAKALNTFEHTLESLLQSGICRPEEAEAFKKGFQCALDLVRREYGIKIIR